MSNKLSDGMTTCRHCGSEYCYQTTVEGKSVNWACLLCGYTTSTGMLENTSELHALLAGLPKLYQELADKDEDGFVWVPQYKKVDGKGEVYANILGQGPEWCWTAALHIPMPESEKEMYKNPDGTYRVYKADAANAKNFHKDAFAGALHYIGLI